MLPAWVVEAAIRVALRRWREKHMLKQVKWSAAAALIIGSVTQTLGIDLADEQVDVLVNALAIVVYIVSEVIEHRRKLKV